jgi:protein TonB
VITRRDEGTAAEASSFDIVTGGGERYAGGVTSSAGKSKVAVREVLASYEQVLLAWIERHKRYPRNALRRRIEGRPILEIRIDRNGRLLDYRLTEPSRQAELDEAAVSLVQRASPFPAVPADHTESTFTFRFGVNFSISGH